MAPRRIIPRRPFPAFRRVLRRRRPTRWTANIDPEFNLLTPESTLEIAITDETVYRQNQFLEASLATCVRVVGDLAFFSVSASSMNVRLGLFRLDSDDPTPSLLNVDNYINERMLWSRMVVEQAEFAQLAGGDTFTIAHTVPVDWKGAARLQSGRISMVVHNANLVGGQSIAVAWQLRALIAGVF